MGEMCRFGAGECVIQSADLARTVKHEGLGHQAHDAMDFVNSQQRAKINRCRYPVYAYSSLSSSGI